MPERRGGWREWLTNFVDRQNQEVRDFRNNLRSPSNWDDAAGQLMRTGVAGPVGMGIGYLMDYLSNRNSGGPERFNQVSGDRFNDRMDQENLWGNRFDRLDPVAQAEL